MQTPTVHTHENQTLYLETEHGQRYIIHPNGDVERTDMLLEPSGQWKMVGIQRTGRSKIIPLDLVTPEWKNLRGSYHLVDFDHGTLRIWGETITNITFYPSPQDTHYYKNVKQRQS